MCARTCAEIPGGAEEARVRLPFGPGVAVNGARAFLFRVMSLVTSCVGGLRLAYGDGSSAAHAGPTRACTVRVSFFRDAIRHLPYLPIGRERFLYA